MLISIACAVPFNPMVAIAPPRMDAAHAVVVAGQLLTTTPADAEARTRHMCDAMRERRDAVKAVIRVRKRPAKGLRPALSAVDNAWGSLVQRLEAAERLPGGGELAQSAGSLLRTLVPDGLVALRVETDTKHSESERMLAVIDAQGLAPEIDRIAGAGYLQAVRDAHAALNEAMGLGGSAVPYGPTDLQLALGHLTAAMQLYMIQLASEVDPGSEDSVRRFDAAVAPIVRARNERSSSPPVDDTTTTDTTEPTQPAEPTQPTTTASSGSASNGTPAPTEPTVTNGAAHA